MRALPHSVIIAQLQLVRVKHFSHLFKLIHFAAVLLKE